MRANQLLYHFDQISDAPDAIPRLRRFILDLAVRGKLVEQDLNYEPASELLKRIDTKRAWVAKEEKIKNMGLIAPGSTDEVWSVPNTWVFFSLEVLAMPDGLFTDGDWVDRRIKIRNAMVHSLSEFLGQLAPKFKGSLPGSAADKSILAQAVRELIPTSRWGHHIKLRI